MQHLVVILSALLSLVVAAAIVAYLLKRRPLLFVADKLPGNLYSGADDVGDLVTGPDGEETMARTGVDVSESGADVGTETGESSDELPDSGPR